jgi:hypothetical protein
MVIKLHDNVQQHIRRKNEQYASKANEGCRRVIFESSDWVWLHIRGIKYFQLIKDQSCIIKEVVLSSPWTD